MSINLIIRQEQPKDYPLVSNLISAAFKNEPHSDQTESLLVGRLRKSEAFIPELSLVAELDGKIVGHILLTKIKIVNKGNSFESLALAPVSVLPAYQRKGIGRKLILEAHKIAKQLGYKSVALIGHENYYPKFGYKKASEFKITFPFEAPDENCMVFELFKNSLKNVKGMVEYPKEFFEQQ